MNTSDILNSLTWRYATKSFDGSKTIPADQWNALEQSLILTPSSFGLQPWKFVVITNPTLRTALLPHSWNQSQVVDASHLVVIAGRTSITPNDVSSFIASIADTRGVAVEALSDYQGMIQGFIGAQSPDQHTAWIAKQCYIALGFFLETAALLGIDTCPMEGFIASEYDRLLELTDKGYTSVVVVAAGYRSPSDHHATAKKVRFAARSLFQHHR